MSSGNPTLDAANESTGIEPLNSGPTEPQLPKQDVEPGYETPSALASLPPGYEFVSFPLDLLSKKKNNQTVSSLPSASKFEDLVRAKITPAGPARAEEVGLDGVGNEQKEMVDKVRTAVGGGDVKAYEVETGVGKGELYIVGLDVDGERIVGVRIP
jgi:hypothetical protein